MKEVVIGFSFMMHMLWWTIIMVASSYRTTMKLLNKCSGYYNGNVISYQTWRSKRQHLFAPIIPTFFKWQIETNILHNC